MNPELHLLSLKTNICLIQGVLHCFDKQGVCVATAAQKSPQQFLYEK